MLEGVDDNSQQKISIPFKNEQQYCVSSQFTPLYQEWMNPVKIDLQKYIDSFSKNGILFSLDTPYVKFNFSIERLIPYLGYYRFHVQIAHFKLKINIAKYQYNSSFKINKNSKGYSSNIYFSNLQGNDLCFKSYKYTSQKSFQRIFSKAIKQWSILRICSILEVTPHISNNLGFDMIVYEDCIEFAIQQGKELSSLTNEDVNWLKDGLNVMHKFNIIHSDIKPDNIVFSQYFNKPVFIDFGFSEIIQENIGNKTFTSFKGTPNFCTQQMLALILDTHGFIDLYYNDAFSLKETYRCLRNVNTFVEEEEEMGNFNVVREREEVQEVNNQAEYIFYAIQFHYINRNELKVRQLLNQYLRLSKSNIRKLLIFMKQIAEYIVLSSFLYQSLKQYQNLVEYRQIQQKIKYTSEMLYFNKNTEKQQLSNKQEILFCSHSQEGIEEHNYQNYFKFIVNIKKIEPNNIKSVLVLVFHSVKFDHKNLDFQDKLKIAKKINPMLLTYYKQKIQLQSQDIIKQVKNTDHKQLTILMKLIMKLFLVLQFSRETKDLLFDIFQQNIILNQYLELIPPFFKFIALDKQIFQPTFVIYQLKRLAESISMMKVQTVYNNIIPKVQFEKYMYNYLNQCNLNLSNLSYPSFNFDLTQQLQNTLEQTLKTIQNPEIRKHLFCSIIYDKIRLYYQSGKTTNFMKIIQIIKRSIQISKIDFMSWAKINIDLMYFTYNQTALQNYYQYIANVINSPSIYQQLNLQTYIRTNTQPFSKKIGRVIECMPYLGNQRYYQILELIQFITAEDEDTVRSLNNDIVELYKIYQQIQHRVVFDKDEHFSIYVLVYHRMSIQLYFYVFSEQTKKAFLSTLSTNQQELQIIKKSQSLQEPNLQKFTYFKVYIYRYFLSIQNKQYEDSYSYLQKLIDICYSLYLVFLIQKFIKGLYIASIRNRNLKLLQYSIHKFYNFIKQNNQYVLYLLPINKYILSDTLQIYALQNHTLFHQICIKLTQYLSNNPYHSMKSQFIILLEVIDRFLKRNCRYGYLMHYTRFSNESNFKNNPYLLIFYIYSLRHQDRNLQLKLLRKIAANCTYLCRFARKILLEKYFRVIIDFIKEKDKRNRIYVFRQAKNYLDEKSNSKQVKSLFSKLNKSKFHRKLKNKMKLYIKEQKRQ